MCKLCNQVLESAAHLLFGCRYTIRVWGLIKDWLGLPSIAPILLERLALGQILVVWRVRHRRNPKEGHQLAHHAHFLGDLEQAERHSIS